MNSTTSTISLYVNNEYLESGRDSFYTFDTNGGSIGSSELDNWVIQDDQMSIQPNHLVIKFVDGMFCVFALHKIYINGAYFDAANNRIRLQTADILEIGKIRIKVSINLDGIDRSAQLSTPPEYLISTVVNPLDELIAQPANSNMADYLKSIEPTVDGNHYSDPLKLLESEHLTTLNETIDKNELEKVLNSNVDLSQTTNGNNDVLAESFMDIPQFESKLSNIPSPYSMDVQLEHSLRDVVSMNSLTDNEYTYLNPIIKNINPELNFHNSKQVYDFLDEVGKTIYEVIQGILSIQKQVHISDTQLRPLEDNPLRLGLDYATTIDMLFSEAKSPVHLSAHASVAELLNNVILHQQANSIAIDEALKALLEAFSPNVLEDRFKKYRKTEDSVNEQDPKWIWEMYSNYYKELVSSRQQGFKKLFKEVYDQVYNRELRRLQQGN